MPSTYMELTNRLLRRLNEVEITQSDFASARGIQATAKDCILDTVREINTYQTTWPFNAMEHTEVLSVGTEEYAWPETFVMADWNSFQLQKDDALGINHRNLKLITREEWYNHFRDMDYDSESDGLRAPDYIFPSHGQGYGVSPSPDQAYTLKYRYYKNPTDLSNYDDEVTIYDRWDYVIIAGALYHMNMFKENPEGVNIMRQKYQEGLDAMVNNMLPNPTYMYTSLVNLGGGADYTHSGFLWNYRRG